MHMGVLQRLLALFLKFAKWDTVLAKQGIAL